VSDTRAVFALLAGAPDQSKRDADVWMHALRGGYLNKRVVEWNEQDVVAWLQVRAG
jgi:hypothetical protein